MSTSSPALKTRSSDSFDLPDEAKADDQYVVEKVLAKRRSRKGKWEYLLKWAGFGNDDNTWEGAADIHPDLIAEFERQQVVLDAANPIYSTLGDDAPSNSHEPPSPPKEAPPAKKKKTSNHSSTTATVKEPKKKLFGVEKGWRVRAVIGAAKQKDSSVLYAVDYAQGSPLLREYVPSDIAHVYIPRELIEFFQKKIVWNSSNESKKT